MLLLIVHIIDVTARHPEIIWHINLIAINGHISIYFRTSLVLKPPVLDSWNQCFWAYLLAPSMLPNPRVFCYQSFSASLQDTHIVAWYDKLMEYYHNVQVQRNYSIIYLGRCTHLIISKIVSNTNFSYLSKYFIYPYILGNYQALPWYFII